MRVVYINIAIGSGQSTSFLETWYFGKMNKSVEREVFSDTIG